MAEKNDDVATVIDSLRELVASVRELNERVESQRKTIAQQDARIRRLERELGIGKFPQIETKSGRRKTN